MKKLIVFVLVLISVKISAQDTNPKYPLPVTFTAEQDHQNMMDQLGIRALRPGPSGDDAAPNHANYDESLANPYPILPDVLTLKNGKKVTTPEMWWNQRRPEIAEDMEREVYGRIPKNAPKVSWEVKITDKEWIGFTPVIAKKLIGHVDNAAYSDDSGDTGECEGAGACVNDVWPQRASRPGPTRQGGPG